MIDLIDAMSLGPVEIARKLWSERYKLTPGMVSAVQKEFTVELHCLNTNEYVFMLNNVSSKDKSAIMDILHEDAKRRREKPNYFDTYHALVGDADELDSPDEDE